MILKQTRYVLFPLVTSLCIVVSFFVFVFFQRCHCCYILDFLVYILSIFETGTMCSTNGSRKVLSRKQFYFEVHSLGVIGCSRDGDHEMALSLWRSLGRSNRWSLCYFASLSSLQSSVRARRHPFVVASWLSVSIVERKRPALPRVSNKFKHKAPKTLFKVRNIFISSHTNNAFWNVELRDLFCIVTLYYVLKLGTHHQKKTMFRLRLFRELSSWFFKMFWRNGLSLALVCMALTAGETWARGLIFQINIICNMSF